jgi:hypothetical protein
MLKLGGPRASSWRQLKRNPNISARINEILAERESIHAQATAEAINLVKRFRLVSFRWHWTASASVALSDVVGRDNVQRPNQRSGNGQIATDQGKFVQSNMFALVHRADMRLRRAGSRQHHYPAR